MFCRKVNSINIRANIEFFLKNIYKLADGMVLPYSAFYNNIYLDKSTPAKMRK